MVIRRAETVIKKPADAVWARIRDFGDISWIPLAEAATMDGNDRSVTRKAWGDFALVQRLVEHDDARRTWSYTLPGEVLNLEPVAGPGYIVHYLNGTLTVNPQGESESFVTWDIDTEPFMVENVRAEYQGALDNLKGMLEG